jgi:hypothetical protein
MLGGKESTTQTHRRHSKKGIHAHGRVVWWWLTSQITTQIQVAKYKVAHTHNLLFSYSSLPSIPYPQTPFRHQPSLSLPSSRYNPPSDLPFLIYSLLRRLQSDTRCCIVSFFIPTSFLSFLCQSTTTRSFLQSSQSTPRYLSLRPIKFPSESRYTASSIALKTSSGRSLSGRVT